MTSSSAQHLAPAADAAHMLTTRDALEVLLAAPDAVIVVDEGGKIDWANPRASLIFGYDAGELAGRPIESLIPEDLRAPHARYRRAYGTAAERHVMAAARRVPALRKDGTTFDAEVTLCRTVMDKRACVVAFVRDYEELTAADDLMRRIEQAAGPLAGQDFLDAIVSELGRALGAACVIVGELGDAATVRTAAVWRDGSIAGNFAYALKGTPGDRMAGDGSCVISRRASVLFPGDELLAQLGGESYVSITLAGPGGEALGVLVVIGREPLAAGGPALSALHLLARRIATELDRRRCEIDLRDQARLLDAIGQAVIGTDIDGRVTFWNEAAEDLYGWSSAEAQGVILAQGAVPGTEGVWQVLRTRSDWSGELVARRRDGSPTTVLATISPVVGSSGKIVGTIAVSQDMTSRRQLEAALKDIEGQFHNSLVCLPVVAFALDAQDRFIEFHATVPEALSIAPEDFIGKRAQDLYSGAEELRERLNAEGGQSLSAAVEYDGRTTEVHLRRVVDDAGGDIGTVGVVVDAAERRRHEAVRTSADISRSVLDSMDRCIAVLDQDGTVIDVNASWRRFAEENGGDAWGPNLPRWNYLDVCRQAIADRVPDAERLTAGLRGVLAGRLRGFEFTYPCHSPLEQRWFTMHAVPLAGAATGAVVFHRDVTEQRRADELASALRALQENAELKNRLLRMVSHEFRTPLSIIRGYLTMIVEYEDRLGPGDLAAALGNADAAVGRLDRMVESVLTLSRFTSGMQAMDRKLTDVPALVRQALSTLEPVLAHRRCSLRLASGPLLALLDEMWMQQAIFNLIDNAVKYGGAAPIEIYAGMRHGQVLLTVRDHGPGVPADQLSAIFEEFRRLPDEQGNARPGFGLGLSTCRAIVEAHGGHIWAELPRGGGLRVCIALEAVEPGGSPG